MCPACLCGRSCAAGLEGIRAESPIIPARFARDDTTECSRSGMPTDFAISCCCAPCEGVGRVSR